jgi:biopolymer transport protein ExbD
MASADDKSFDDINVTPMVDLYLVLLLIFIVMTAAGVKGVKVDLPKAGGKANADVGAPKIQAITIDSEGKITLNLTPMSLEELESKISAMVASTSDLPFVVRGDSSAQYQKVMAVVTILGKNGISKIGLATQPNK